MVHREASTVEMMRTALMQHDNNGRGLTHKVFRDEQCPGGMVTDLDRNRSSRQAWLHNMSKATPETPHP
jgi:hypothetical protein